MISATRDNGAGGAVSAAAVQARTRGAVGAASAYQAKTSRDIPVEVLEPVT